MELLTEVSCGLEEARCSVSVGEEFVARRTARHCDDVLTNLREITEMVKYAKEEVTFN
eukprot:COSAG05_NODE_191_length_14617_cov_90.240736_8_plen_58_part_00